jgi:hypothetical protein
MAQPFEFNGPLSRHLLGGSAVLLPFALYESFGMAHAEWSSNASSLVLLAAIFPGVGCLLGLQLLSKDFGAPAGSLQSLPWPLVRQFGGLVFIE